MQTTLVRPKHLGCSQKCGPLVGITFITAPNTLGYQNGTLIWELPLYASRTTLRDGVGPCANLQSSICLQLIGMVTTKPQEVRQKQCCGSWLLLLSVLLLRTECYGQRLHAKHYVQTPGKPKIPTSKRQVPKLAFLPVLQGFCFVLGSTGSSCLVMQEVCSWQKLYRAKVF